VTTRVTVEDMDNGEITNRFIEPGDYICICVAPCHIAQTTVTDSTHVLTIKGRESK